MVFLSVLPPPTDRLRRPGGRCWCVWHRSTLTWENPMKTDLQLQRDVLDELKFEPSIRETELGVAVKDGVVTLTGFVQNYAEKFSAERTAERVNGVRAVADEIKV